VLLGRTNINYFDFLSDFVILLVFVNKTGVLPKTPFSSLSIEGKLEIKNLGESVGLP
jgi:hypothetical protein